MFLSQITVFMQLSPLLIPWDYIHKETQARLPWGHKVPDGQIKSTMLLFTLILQYRDNMFKIVL